MLISHLGEPISLKRLADEVYDNAPRGRREMDDRRRQRKRDAFMRANYQEVQQTCNDLKTLHGVLKTPTDIEKYGIVKSKKVGRESLIYLDIRALVSALFGARKGMKPLVTVANKEKIDWDGIIAWKAKQLKRDEWFLKEDERLVKAGYHGQFVNPATSYDIDKNKVLTLKKELEQLREDAEEARAFGKTSPTSLNEREITFLTKRIDTNRIKEVCNALRKSGMLDYIRGQSNIVTLFIALIKGYSNNIDSSREQCDRMLSMLGLKDIDTKPITNVVISSFVLLSQHPEVIEFRNTHYVSRPRD